MPTTAIIGAVGSLAGAGISAAASGSAASQQSQAAIQAAQLQSSAANNAANIQLGMFNQIRSDLTPYRDIGTSAIPTYSALLGLPTGSTGATVSAGTPTATTGGSLTGQPDWNAYLTNNPDLASYYQQNASQLAMMGITSPQAYAQWHWQNYGQNEAAQPGSTRVSPYGATAAAATGTAPAATSAVPDTAAMQTALENTPGYQFTKSQGEQAVENSMAAKGLGGVSGSLGKGLARFVTGLADQTYQTQLGNYATAVGTGQSAANQTGAFGTTATTNAANSLIGGANAAAAGTVGAAQAGASGTLGAATAANSGLNGAYNSYLTSQILGMYGNNSSAPGNTGVDGLY